MTSTSDFYLQNAQQFYDSTVSVEASELYERFLPLIPAGGRILDAGCGSGRDARAFFNRGYEVTGFDACAPLAEMASKLLEQPVMACQFNEFTSELPFDGIWACASLLHIIYADLAETMNYLASFLLPSGYFYCSFKYGEGEGNVDGRHFTYLNENGMQSLSEQAGLSVYQSWVTHDLRPERANEKWLNVVLRHAP